MSGSLLAEPARWVQVAGSTLCRKAELFAVHDSHECFEMLKVLVSRGGLLNPRTGIASSAGVHAAYSIPPIHTVVQRFEAWINRTSSKPMHTIPDQEVASTSLEALRAPLPPVVLVGRHPASRFLSALLNKVV